MTSILVATDFSESAHRAILRAIRLGEEHRAPVEILHVVEDLPQGDATLSAGRLDEIDKALKKLSADLVARDVAIRCHIDQGKDFVAIIRRARQLPAELIVIGAHGKLSLKDEVFGTTGQKLARKADTALLVVKKPARSAYQRILAATDFSAASRQALELAMHLAPQADIDLLHVYGGWGESRLSMAGAGPQDRNAYRLQMEKSAAAMLQDWVAQIEPNERRLDLLIRQGHPANLISHLATERQADLVVMGTTGQSGLPYILLGSVAEKTLHTVPCDTLIVRPQGFRFELP